MELILLKKVETKKQGKALKNSLEFYKVIAKASPPGELFLEAI